LTEFGEQPRTFRFSFGLDELPKEPGIILIRGPRQYGKSTWLELMLRESLEENGKGSAYFLNGDEFSDEDELEARIVETVTAFNPGARTKRLFVDEISAVPRWERALKLDHGSCAAFCRDHRPAPQTFGAARAASVGKKLAGRVSIHRISTRISMSVSAGYPDDTSIAFL
jgi:hypothetical protein